jgi:hypothetical protein
MPRQNRVTPSGEIVATKDRGLFFGNRGVLHGAEGRIRRPWQNRRWIICLLTFKGRKRTLLTPGHYTELFFLDEATALAAGHRPCAECRWERYNAFRLAWALAVRATRSNPLPAAKIDDRLHSDRLAPDGSQRCFPAALGDLPGGVFVRLDPSDANSYLVWGDHLLRWSTGGYTSKVSRSRRSKVQVLTPASTVAVLRSGYSPVVHPTAVTAAAGRRP